MGSIQNTETCVELMKIYNMSRLHGFGGSVRNRVFTETYVSENLEVSDFLTFDAYISGSGLSEPH